MRNFKLIGIGIVLICLSVLMLTGIVQAAYGDYEDSFQNHPGQQLTNQNENNLSWTTVLAGEGSNPVIARTFSGGAFHGPTYGDYWCMFRYGNGNSGSMKTNELTSMDYIGFNVYHENHGGGSSYIKFYFYDIDDNILCTSSNMNSVIDSFHHYELIHSGSTVLLYEDGVYKANTGCSFSDKIYYFKIGCSGGSGVGAAQYLRMDDFSIQGDMISAIPHDWYVRRDINNDALSGLYDEGHNLKDANLMNASYTWRNQGGEGVADTIKMYHFSENWTFFNSVDVYTDSAASLQYNFTDIIMQDNHLNDLYGLYILNMYRGTTMIAQDTFDYRYITSGIFSGTVSFDKDLYAAGEIAQISTTLTDENFVTHDFIVNISAISTGALADSHAITTDPDSYYWDTTGLSPDYYYAQLYAINKSTGFSFALGWDKCKVTEKVTVSGTTYNAHNGTALGDVDVKYIQGENIYGTSSDASGDYDIGEVEVSILTSINASKAAYLHNNFTATFLASGTQDMDLWLLPDASTLPHSGTTIAGLAQTYPYHQPVLNATINIWNDTWSNSTTTTSSGFYYFENLVHGTYWMNATAGWHEATDDEQVTTNSGTVKYQYFLLNPLYTLTVSAKNADTLLTITEFNAILDSGDKINTTTDGTCEIHNVGWGIHKLETSSVGYYGSIEYVNVFGDTSYTSYLTPLAEGAGAGTYYQYHYVKFLVKRCSLFGYFFCEPEPGVSVDAILLTGNVTNTTMSGITDSDGGVTFKMTQDIKYQINFTKGGWSDQLNIYPKYEEYWVPISGGALPSFDKDVDWEFSNNEIDDDDIYLNFSYNDTGLRTHTLTFEVYRAVKSDLYVYNASNRIELYNSTQVDTSAYNFSYVASDWHNNTFIVSFNSTYSDDYSPKSEIKVYAFEPLSVPRIDLGFTNSIWYFVLSVISLLCVGSLFSGPSTKVGVVVIGAWGLILNYFGWLTYSNAPEVLLIVFIIGVLIYIKHKGQEERIV